MANISTAQVDIEARGCFKEFMEYVEKAQAEAYYSLIERATPSEVNEATNSGKLQGFASGRWNYEHNLEGYLAMDEAKARQ